MKKILIFMFLAILLATNSAAAQLVVKLKTGEVVEGEISGQLQYNLIMNVAGTDKIIFKDEIASINKSANSPATDTSNKKIITGWVTYDNYKQGSIIIRASNPFSKEGLLDRTAINGPGVYTLTVPENYSSVYLVAFNDIDNDGPPPQAHDPYYPKTSPPEPVKLTGQITIIDFALTEP